MSWKNALKKSIPAAVAQFCRPAFKPSTVDWARLVTVDFETFFDVHYTLRKMATSEYVRSDLFKAQMVAIKVGLGPTKIYDGKKGFAALKRINWSTHSLLCHNTAFDGFIMSHHLGIVPARYYDTLSMARGLHSNEIGAGLDEVAKFYGGEGKIDGFLEKTKGVLDWSKELFAEGALYCAQDNDECFRIFQAMHPQMPSDEMDLIDLTIRMFCDPVLKVDISRVEAEYAREVAKRERLFYDAVNPDDYDVGGKLHDLVFFKKSLLKTGAERELQGTERRMQIVKRLLGNNDFFADLLRSEGVEPPVKISPAWIKKPVAERDDAEKYAFAFAKDDLAFTGIPDDIDLWRGKLDPNKASDVAAISAKQDRLRDLVGARLAVKSTTNITRAERFLEAGKDGMSLPVGYSYYRAHTGRFGGNNKMNCIPGESEVLTRAGWVPIADFDDSEQAAVWDANDHQVVFANVKRISLDYAGPMVRAKTHTGTHDALYTPDHGLPVATYRNKTGVTRRTAGEMIGSSDWLLPVAGGYSNSSPALRVSVPLARFAAAMQADGSIVPNSPGSTAAQFGFTKQRKITRFRELCASAELHYTETTTGAYTKFYVNHGQAPLAMFKYFNSWMLGLSGEALSALVDEAAYWDGHSRGDSYLYSSAIKSNAEWLQTAAHLSGRSAQIQEVDNFHGWNTNPDAKLWVVNVKPRPYVTNEKDRQVLTLEDGFNGKVFCLSTPTGWFMMRHNGSIHVTGNCQNLMRGGELRLSIVAPPGHQVAVQDSGQIEARVGAWLWEQEDLVEAFRKADRWSKDKGVARGEDRDAYCRFADVVYGREITTADKMERFVGKVCVLGLSFKMGAPKFQMTLAKGALGGPPVYFELDECHRIVNAYRSTNYKIRDGWKICSRIIEDMAAGRTGAHKCLSWEKSTIWLPNGMSLKYPDLRQARNEEKGWDEWSYQSGDMRKRIYDGLLSENLAQSLARIIVMQQMLAISRKYRVVMTTHDEVVTLPKTRDAQKCIDFMAKCMSTAPAWCSDIPLNCEGGYAENYSK